MKRLIIAAIAAAGLFAVPSAPATIHPIMLGWWCGNASGNPPGQTPGENHADQSTLRAVQALVYSPTSQLLLGSRTRITVLPAARRAVTNSSISGPSP